MAIILATSAHAGSSELQFNVSHKRLAVKQSFRFEAQGGQPPYVYFMNGEGRLSADGTYTAPDHPGRAAIRVVDASGASVEAQVVVGAELTLTPSEVTIEQSGRTRVNVMGGVPPYRFVVAGGGGSVDGRGVYTALAHYGDATIVATDSAGSTQQARVHVMGAGRVDPNFGDHGRVDIQRFFHNNFAMTRLKGGGLAVAALELAEDYTIERIRVGKIDSSGQFDRRFGQDGTGVLQFKKDFSVHVEGLIEDSRGRLLVTAEGADGMVVARFLANGDVDSSWGGGGHVGWMSVDPYPASVEHETKVSSIAVQSDGRVWVSGYSRERYWKANGEYDFEKSNDSYRAIVVGLKENGSLDPSVGPAGFVKLPDEGKISRVQLLPKGASSAWLVFADSKERIQLGTLGSNGEIGPSHDTSVSVRGGDLSLRTDREGCLFVLVKNVNDGLMVARFDLGGQLDDNYGQGGIASLNTRAYYFGQAAWDIDSTGRVLMGGVTYKADGAARSQLTVVRLTQDGKMDPAFGYQGRREFLPALNARNWASGIAEIPGRGIAVAIAHEEIGSSPSEDEHVIQLLSP